MLLWASSAIRHDHIENEDIRHRLGIAPILSKLRERHFLWYGYKFHTDENLLAKIIEVDRKRPMVAFWPAETTIA